MGLPQGANGLELPLGIYRGQSNEIGERDSKNISLLPLRSSTKILKELEGPVSIEPEKKDLVALIVTFQRLLIVNLALA